MKLAKIGKKVALSLQALVLVMGIGSAGLVAGTVAVAVTPSVASAACATDPSASANPLAEGAACSKAKGTSDNLFGENGIFMTIANTLIFLIGAIAVLFLIIGGLRYVISNGDPKNVEAAKNTILYAIIGIVVAVLSFAAVQFVIGAFTAAPTAT